MGALEQGTMQASRAFRGRGKRNETSQGASRLAFLSLRLHGQWFPIEQLKEVVRQSDGNFELFPVPGWWAIPGGVIATTESVIRWARAEGVEVRN